MPDTDRAEGHFWMLRRAWVIGSRDTWFFASLQSQSSQCALVRFAQPSWTLRLQHPCPTLGQFFWVLAASGPCPYLTSRDHLRVVGRRPSRGAVRVKLPSRGAPSAGKACDIRVAPAPTLEWVCRPADSAYGLSRGGIGAESEYRRGVKACRAEPGHSMPRAPC